MYILILMPWLEFGREDGVPNDGARRGSIWFMRRVDCDYVDEYLLRVPSKERG